MSSRPALSVAVAAPRTAADGTSPTASVAVAVATASAGGASKGASSQDDSGAAYGSLEVHAARAQTAAAAHDWRTHRTALAQALRDSLGTAPCSFPNELQQLVAGYCATLRGTVIVATLKHFDPLARGSPDCWTALGCWSDGASMRAWPAPCLRPGAVASAAGDEPVFSKAGREARYRDPGLITRSPMVQARRRADDDLPRSWVPPLYEQKARAIARDMELNQDGGRLLALGGGGYVGMIVDESIRVYGPTLAPNPLAAVTATAAGVTKTAARGGAGAGDEPAVALGYGLQFVLGSYRGAHVEACCFLTPPSRLLTAAASAPANQHNGDTDDADVESQSFVLSADHLGVVTLWRVAPHWALAPGTVPAPPGAAAGAAARAREKADAMASGGATQNAFAAIAEAAAAAAANVSDSASQQPRPQEPQPKPQPQRAKPCVSRYTHPAALPATGPNAHERERVRVSPPSDALRVGVAVAPAAAATAAGAAGAATSGANASTGGVGVDPIAYAAAARYVRYAGSPPELSDPDHEHSRHAFPKPLSQRRCVADADSPSPRSARSTGADRMAGLVEPTSCPLVSVQLPHVRGAVMALSGVRGVGAGVEHARVSLLVLHGNARSGWRVLFAGLGTVGVLTVRRVAAAAASADAKQNGSGSSAGSSSGSGGWQLAIEFAYTTGAATIEHLSRHGDTKAAGPDAIKLFATSGVVRFGPACRLTQASPLVLVCASRLQPRALTDFVLLDTTPPDTAAAAKSPLVATMRSPLRLGVCPRVAQNAGSPRFTGDPATDGASTDALLPFPNVCRYMFAVPTPPPPPPPAPATSSVPAAAAAAVAAGAAAAPPSYRVTLNLDSGTALFDIEPVAAAVGAATPAAVAVASSPAAASSVSAAAAAKDVQQPSVVVVADEDAVLDADQPSSLVLRRWDSALGDTPPPPQQQPQQPLQQQATVAATATAATAWRARKYLSLKGLSGLSHNIRSWARDIVNARGDDGGPVYSPCGTYWLHACDVPTSATTAPASHNDMYRTHAQPDGSVPAATVYRTCDGAMVCHVFVRHIRNEPPAPGGAKSLASGAYDPPDDRHETKAERDARTRAAALQQAMEDTYKLPRTLQPLRCLPCGRLVLCDYSRCRLPSWERHSWRPHTDGWDGLNTELLDPNDPEADSPDVNRATDQSTSLVVTAESIFSAPDFTQRIVPALHARLARNRYDPVARECQLAAQVVAHMEADAKAKADAPPPAVPAVSKKQTKKAERFAKTAGAPPGAATPTPPPAAAKAAAAVPKPKDPQQKQAPNLLRQLLRADRDARSAELPVLLVSLSAELTSRWTIRRVEVADVCF